ncbi:hypothetical protein F2Q68_00019788 [Brassica cretica]|nr:hypothetical protein F2Q68_00019788 [Brassica cretica]
MELRNWDPGNQGVRGFFYGILHYQDAIVRMIHGSFKDLKHKDLFDGGGTSPRAGAAKEAREEGEIQQQERGKSSRNEHEAPPMIPLQENLASSIILADVQKVTSAPECEENGLDVVNELLGDENNDVENDVMELDEERVHGMGNDEGSGDGFQNLYHGEVEVNSDQATEVVNLADGDVVNDLPEEKDPVVGEADKKKVVRKGLFKSTVVAGGSTKARMVQALMATRKRTATKPATHQGEGAKQQEKMGPSNPKP